MAWTNIANANLDVGAPIRSVDILALRDNITALANGDTGAPSIKAAALGAGQTGNAPIFAARAFVNFDGSNAFTPNPSTSAIRKSGNVSSISKLGTGSYVVNFATALPDANYSLIGVSRTQNGNNAPSIFSPFVTKSGSDFAHQSPTTTTSHVISGLGNTSGTFDSDYIMVAVFG